MSPTTYFSPESIHRMRAVYERAVQELNLERAPVHERDRLAVYILSTSSRIPVADVPQRSGQLKKSMTLSPRTNWELPREASPR